MAVNARAEIYKHIQTVQRLLGRCIRNLMLRGEVHDASRLESPEAEIFEVATEKLAGLTYGSDEYKAALAEMKPALDHHYANNRHHPEFHARLECGGCFKKFPDGWEKCCDACGYNVWPRSPCVDKMTLLDLVEMLCDWKAATMRHRDGDIRRSVEINQSRFGYGDELKQIFLNTIDEIESNRD